MCVKDFNFKRNNCYLELNKNKDVKKVYYYLF